MKRKMFLMTLVAFVTTAMGLVSCEEPGVEGPKVATSESSLLFSGENNADAIIDVFTKQGAWTVNDDYPEWILVNTEDDALFINVDKNMGDFRTGKVKIMVNGEVAMTIFVAQDPLIAGPAQLSMQDESGETTKRFTMYGSDHQARFFAMLNKAVPAAVNVKVVVDEEYMAEFDFFDKGREFEIFPSELLTLSNNGEGVIPAGSRFAPTITADIEFDDTKLVNNHHYLIPLVATYTSDEKVVLGQARVNYIVTKRVNRVTRNILYFEVNDVNPLNALEYKLDNGEYFFDAIVLFSSNINYNATQDRVFVHNNPNNQALLDEYDTYIKPLQDAGMKVYFAILGNGDAAGVCQLSDWGAKQFARSLATVVNDYGFDGVAFDDEYSKAIIDNPWFAQPSGKQGARLCYESKMAMREICGEDRDVQIFDYGTLAGAKSNTIDGVSPNDFIDVCSANYFSRSSGLSGAVGNSKYSYESVEINRGYTAVNEATGREAREAGYGWIMWFSLSNKETALHKGHNISTYTTGLTKMTNVTLGMFPGRTLTAPTHYYAKIGEGKFDPNRYAY